MNKWQLFEVEQWADADGGYYDNSAYNLGEYRTRDDVNEKRAFLYQLKKRGISCKREKCSVWFDGFVLELVERKTGEVYYRAIFQY